MENRKLVFPLYGELSRTPEYLMVVEDKEDFLSQLELYVKTIDKLVSYSEGAEHLFKEVTFSLMNIGVFELDKEIREEIDYTYSFVNNLDTKVGKINWVFPNTSKTAISVNNLYDIQSFILYQYGDRKEDTYNYSFRESIDIHKLINLLRENIC